MPSLGKPNIENLSSSLILGIKNLPLAVVIRKRKLTKAYYKEIHKCLLYISKNA